MLQIVEDMLEGSADSSERRAIWRRVALDLPVSATKAQVSGLEFVFKNETPTYLKGSGLLTLLLILPFFSALSANGIDKVFNNRTLLNSWVWQMPTLGIWVLWAPLAALVIALITYFRFTVGQGTGLAGRSWIKRAIDLKHVWPVLVPGVIAFGILSILVLHDSASCWVQTPGHLLSHLSQTWQCTVRHRSIV